MVQGLSSRVWDSSFGVTALGFRVVTTKTQIRTEL